MAAEEIYPCPECGEACLVYDGALVWRSGTRPPRELARKDLNFMAVPRTDYERECHYHCTHCGAAFFEDVDSSLIHLYGHDGAICYVYNVVEETWQYDRFDRVEGCWQVFSFDRAERRWVARPRDQHRRGEKLHAAFIGRRPRVWRLYYKR
jgi:hypothetical protein